MNHTRPAMVAAMATKKFSRSPRKQAEESIVAGLRGGARPAGGTVYTQAAGYAPWLTVRGSRPGGLRDVEELVMPEELGEEFWDERYRSAAALWSGNPNRYLVSETADLTPGRALDAGSGEGADAIWLAGRGWQVTAVDFSAVALQRAAAHARQRGSAVAARIEWAKEDLTTWIPSPGRYDLVTAQYLHLPSVVRPVLFRRLAAAVAVGGTLLIAGHHPSDLQTTMPRPQDPDRYFTGDEAASALEPRQWDIITNATPERAGTDPDGHIVILHDTVFRAQRRT